VPIPKAVARFNKYVTNPVTRRFATWLPGFAVVNHVGRRSGRHYRTPVNVFHEGERYVFALTYGRDTDWVRNVVAAGGCEIEWRRKRVRLVDPQLFRDSQRRAVPVIVRAALTVFRVTDFLSLREPKLVSDTFKGV
jgi:deazaflavin-dependent oxidoreductase (nitroreductase family)